MCYLFVWSAGALQGVRQIQKSILHGYEQDFSKHAPKEQVEKIKLVWKSIPSRLFKENKKFIYGVLRKGARAMQYEELNIFKLYALDVGLLGAMANTDSSQILIKSDFRSNSLSTLLQNTPGLQAIRYSMRPYKEQDALTNVPLYAV